MYWKATEQFFTLVLFVFQFHPVCNFGNVRVMDLAVSGVKA